VTDGNTGFTNCRGNYGLGGVTGFGTPHSVPERVPVPGVPGAIGEAAVP
jgi:hypothetical protein